MEPQDREETYLANAAGQDVQLPPCPWDRKEAYLADIGDRLDGIEEDVETIKNNPDVVDIVDTYADLQAYDKTRLTDNDIIRVLNDERHDGESTYYRYSATTQTFTYVGTTKQYTDFVGTDGTTAGKAGLVPAPATTDAGKFLKADGTWDDAGSSVNVVQTTGTSTTDVMSQNAVTSMVFADPGADSKIQIGSNSSVGINYAIAIGNFAEGTGTNAVAIGGGGNSSYHTVATGNQSVAVGPLSRATSPYSTAIGYYSEANSHSGTALGFGAKTSADEQVAIGTNQVNSAVYGGINDVFIGAKANGTSGLSRSVTGGSIAIGRSARSGRKGSIALGSYSQAAAQGEVNIGTTETNFGYNSSNYRLLSGVYDGQSTHDAATVGQLTPAFTNAEFNSIFNTDLTEN